MRARLRLYGVPQANAAFRALPPALRLEYNETTRRTVARVEAFARGFVPRDRGILADAIGSSFSDARGSGIVGVRKMTVPAVSQRFLKTGRAGDLVYKQPEFYGVLVHNGSLHNPNPVPFMLLAANAANDAYIAETTSATTRGIANAGGRFL